LCGRGAVAHDDQGCREVPRVRAAWVVRGARPGAPPGCVPCPPGRIAGCRRAAAGGSMMDFVVAIPARFAASRLPGKPLRLLGGEPLVAHVVRRALLAGASEVVVATDDQRIVDAVAGLQVRACMTSPGHASGTDRLAECARTLGW